MIIDSQRAREVLIKTDS